MNYADQKSDQNLIEVIAKIAGCKNLSELKELDYVVKQMLVGHIAKERFSDKEWEEALDYIGLKQEDCHWKE